MTPRTIARQAPLSTEFSRRDYWSGLPFPSPGDLPDPGIKPGSPALQADSLPSEPCGTWQKASCCFSSFEAPSCPSPSPPWPRRSLKTMNITMFFCLDWLVTRGGRASGWTLCSGPPTYSSLAPLHLYMFSWGPDSLFSPSFRQPQDLCMCCSLSSNTHPLSPSPPHTCAFSQFFPSALPNRKHPPLCPSDIM